MESSGKFTESSGKFTENSGKFYGNQWKLYGKQRKVDGVLILTEKAADVLVRHHGGEDLQQLLLQVRLQFRLNVETVLKIKGQSSLSKTVK
jgi:hypothetical protein